ncbi:DUF6339 family protein [Tsukamurella paurometabola]|uniref:Uncharacterized protein n=1 Tax=Tsukamurella paurometabola TaxID=2061 RepID=A0ABS5NIS8_TSUPA|nr:DUF6339 family protein [Tsukamurella paurometabola]MBS4103915.1 hypothetical protein [Tsukamurella paurometabola]
MTQLYPRLLPTAAEQLFADQANSSISDLSREARTAHSAAVFVATGGTRVSEADLNQHRKAVLSLALESGFPESTSADDRNRFDIAVARYLHSELAMVPAEASSGDVWAFFAAVLLPDVTHWRFPNPIRDRVLGTDLTRHTFGRLWWRAQLVWSNTSSDPYEALEMIGGEAFGQIYERRVSLGASPALVRAIITIWSELGPGEQKRDLLRDFLKRVLRLTTFVSFESMDTATLRGLLRSILNSATTAMPE